MITGIIGLPGVGKSLILSWIAHRYCSRKPLNVHGFSFSTFDGYEKLYTNFPFEGAYKLDFEKLGFAQYEKCLMLCDEIQLFADSRNFKTFGDNLTEWFTTHRHDRVDFVYCTQDYSMVDKRIRSVTDRIYLLDRVAFGLLRVREIVADHDIHGSLGWIYRYSNSSHYFIPRLLYKFNDSYYRIKQAPREPAPCVPWVSPPSPSTDKTT